MMMSETRARLHPMMRKSVPMMKNNRLALSSPRVRTSIGSALGVDAVPVLGGVLLGVGVVVG